MRAFWLLVIGIILLIGLASAGPIIAIFGPADALARVNYYRGIAGVGSVSLNTDLNEAAQMHAQYCSVEGILTHNETNTTNRYYKGKGPQDRATAAGYPPYNSNTGEYYVAEDGACGRLGPDAIDSWMGGVYHRWIIINPDVREVGYGEDPPYSFMDVGYRAFTLYNPVYYPQDGQTGIPTQFVPETPSPLGNITEAGYPVTVSLPQWSTVTINAEELKVHGQPVDHYYFSPSASPYMWNSVALVAKDVLNPGTKYQAHVAVNVVATPPLAGSYQFDKTWSFTTAISPPSTPTGPNSGLKGQALIYKTKSTDNYAMADNVFYTFDWGDGTKTSTSIVSSGTEVNCSHAWAIAGNYQVTATITSSDGVTSAPSSARTVTICPGGATQLTIDKTGTLIVISFMNGGSTVIELPNTAPLVIKDAAGNIVHSWTVLNVITDVQPGSCMTWNWNRAGEPPGVYKAELKTLDGTIFHTSFTLSGSGPSPNTGILYVASYPTNAIILINGTDFGRTNQFVYNVPAGNQNLTLVKPGYLPYTILVNVPAGGTKILAPVTLSKGGGGPSTGTGILFVASYPTNAIILINGTDFGRTDQFVYNVPAGNQNLTLVKPGYLPYTILVNVPAGGTKILAPVTLSPLPSQGDLFIDSIPDPWTNQSGQFVVPASRYYATGGTAADHEYNGVDSYSLISIPKPEPKWESTYRIDLYHTGDWVVYHIQLGREGNLYKIDVCAKNPYTPDVGTPVDVFAKEGAALPPLHDSDLATVGWRKIGNFTILPAGNWTIYTFYFPYSQMYSPDSFTIGLSLKEGEIGPENSSTSFREDRNLYVAWVKIYAD